MKYTIKLESTVDIPKESRWVLIYERKDGRTNVYPVSEILHQDHRLLKANIIGKGVRSFITSKIIDLSKVNN